MHRTIIDTYIYNYKKKSSVKILKIGNPLRTASKQAVEQLEESRQVVSPLTKAVNGQEKESRCETNSQATKSWTRTPASQHAGPRDDQRMQALRGATASGPTKSASAPADSRSSQ